MSAAATLNNQVNNGQNDFLVSIIVPVYNVEDYILKAIMSLRMQTYENIEILLIDDCSTDRSYDVCRIQALEDTRIKLIRSEKNKGVSYARNLGLTCAKGDFISFVDADDWVEKDMVEYLLHQIISEKADIATCEIVKDFPDGKKQILGCRKNYVEQGMCIIDEINYCGEFSAFLFNKLYKRQLLQHIRFEEGVTIGEDYGFIMKVMMRNPMVVRGGEVKYHYIQHKTSVSYTGYSNPQSVSANRRNYYNIFQMQITYSAQITKSAMAYYVLQEMAIPISMVKAGRYDETIIREVKAVVRKYLKEYLLISRVPFYLKGCAILLSIHENLLLVPYKIMFHKIRSVSK